MSAAPAGDRTDPVTGEVLLEALIDRANAGARGVVLDSASAAMVHELLVANRWGQPTSAPISPLFTIRGMPCVAQCHRGLLDEYLRRHAPQDCVPLWLSD